VKDDLGDNLRDDLGDDLKSNLKVHIHNDHVVKVLFPLELEDEEGKKDKKIEVEFDYSNLKDYFEKTISSCFFCLRIVSNNKTKEKQGEIFPCETDIGINGGPDEYTMTTFSIIQMPDTFSEKEVSLVETAIAYLTLKENEGLLFEMY
jgi:hypothetical protein